MTQVDKLKENIERLRCYLNELVEKNETGPELLLVSQQLDELLVKYYSELERSGSDK